MAGIRPRHALPLALALLVALADVAGAAPYTADGYVLHLDAAAVSAYAGAAGPGAGVSLVELDKTRGQEVGRCETIGASVFTQQLRQQRRPGGHPAALTRDDEALATPTGHRDITPSPNPGGGNWGRGPDVGSYPLAAAGHAVVRHAAEDGPGVRWVAKCDNDSSGRAAAANGDLPGVEALGSATSAEVNRLTMRYVGTARAFVLGVVTPAGSVDAISSFMTVASTPGQEPTATYRVAVTDGSTTSVLASATDVPMSLLTEQFNRSTAGIPAGLRLMDPQVTRAPDGTWTVHAPFVELHTDDHTARLVAVTFSGRR